jgi:hypothetical protein
LFVDIKLKGLSIPSKCTCKKIKCKTIRWNEEFKDEVKSDLMVNVHKFEELFQNITEEGESIDGNVDKMNELLTDIFEKYTKVEVDRTIQYEYCIGRKRASNASIKWDKPWFTEECKILYNNYKCALSIFNDNHSDENRMKLNLEKQKYKRLENKLKRL